MVRFTSYSVLLVALLIVGACGGGGGGGGGSGSGSSVSGGSKSPPLFQPNRAPVFVGADTLALRAVALHFISYDVSQGGTAVVDPDGDALTYSFGECGCRPWLIVAGTTFSGVPPKPGSFQVFFTVSDGRGGTAHGIVNVSVAPNAAPVATQPNGPMLVEMGSDVYYDPTQGGTTFSDADGDELSYEVELLSPPLGLLIVGTDIVGTIDTVGAVNFKITARDDYGASGENTFSFAVAGPEPGDPTLPAIAYIYDDTKLLLPRDFKRSLTDGSPLWDTTPPNNRTTDAGATLGRVLFYDKRLSITNTHSCGSCHQQEHGFATPDRFPVGVVGVPLKRNAMGLTNVRYNASNRYFSDTRVETLEKLALIPIEEFTELGNSLQLLQEKLAATSFYPPLFEAAFGSPEITQDRIARALAQFMRAILSYQTKFDAAHRPDPNGPLTSPAHLYTPQELRGEELFDRGPIKCRGCHETTVQTVGRPMNDGLDVEFIDPGAGDGTFRAASLRNVALTAPYMHDGRFATLRDVIEHYDSGMQFKRADGSVENPQHNLTDADKEALEAFLHTLTDEVMLNDPKFSDPFL